MTEEVEAQWEDIDNIMSGRARSSASETILATLFNSLLPRVGANRATTIPSNFMAPVLVRPSEEQITAGSRLDFVGALTDNQCAICQAGFEIGEERRTLSYCDHEFHRACIDPWFQQNVHCPVCRHDVRDMD